MKNGIRYQKRAAKFGKQSQLYRTYTRQACNFVFPYVNMNVNGELSPDHTNLGLVTKIIDKIEKGKSVEFDLEAKKSL